ncbi:(Fe-S)-binding protein [Bergeyella cardium]|uniref:(Fe-S)-binding protein n=1 Tax=Bergeyella cardium TaxID=1585976 RepID=A0A6P1QS80_9FLAO|nr:(Fe-S)-binding protein [Bergeyella cardium]QHN64962.1 (Fe-S)-binding protein [Bergeyella cardium]WHE34275.1 (Fe-S)-binding protein [Bergeyella cardium]WHF60926.1 (Fe-S)-binding protein [Bergeyella cardium]
MKIKTMAEYAAEGKMPEVLFWVGCAGSFDDRAKRITRAFCKILNHIGVEFAVLGKEESCTGDPAKRAGNEFIFQMMALNNIEVLNAYGVTRIVTACPHGFNILKNEYPQLGGNYEVLHHTQFLKKLMEEGRLRIEGGKFEGKRITFHDPCYLGRGNGEYEAPRQLLEKLDAELVEMKNNRRNAVCCGAGGSQMFKESEKGTQEINVKRTEEALDEAPNIIATGCPFCNTMLTDGIKHFNKNEAVVVKDIAELIAEAEDL